MSILVGGLYMAYGIWEYAKFEEPFGGIWWVLGLIILLLSGP